MLTYIPSYLRIWKFIISSRVQDAPLCAVFHYVNIICPPAASS